MVVVGADAPLVDNMSSQFHVLFVVVIAGVRCLANKYVQERAQIKYYNPKYVTNAWALTGRPRRGESYKTNISATILDPWANNVTFELSYKSLDLPMPLSAKVKLCDVPKIKWMIDFLKAFADFVYNCPFLPGTYGVRNIELPPKNFPLPLPKGDTQFNASYYMTATKETLILITVILHST